MKVPLLISPMAEISHRALRELIEKFGGCDEYFSEMISAGALLAGGPFEKWYTDSGPKPEKVVFQVVGSDSGQISAAAAVLDRLECAGIDINMGCSAPIIRKTGAGAAWMASIDKAGELISLVRPSVKRRLSVKLRIGFKDDFDYLVQFCKRLEAEGVDFITLHPRTIMEKFKRLSRWDYIGLLKKELKIPVAGNGDVASAEDLARRAEGGLCDAVMVGRAAVREPWIFARSRELGVGSGEWGKKINIEETGLQFLELLARYQPPEFHISRALRFFGFFCDNLKWGNYLKTQLNRQKTLSGIEHVWRGHFLDMTH
jgi:tRNA-dihydrouridine synthase